MWLPKIWAPCYRHCIPHALASELAMSRLLAMPRLAAVFNPLHRYTATLKIKERLKSANLRLVRQDGDTTAFFERIRPATEGRR